MFRNSFKYMIFLRNMLRYFNGEIIDFLINRVELIIYIYEKKKKFNYCFIECLNINLK